MTLKEKLKRKCQCKSLKIEPEKVCCKCWIDMSRKFKILVEHKIWTAAIVIIILLNSFTMATYHYE